MEAGNIDLGIGSDIDIGSVVAAVEVHKALALMMDGSFLLMMQEQTVVECEKQDWKKS